MNRILDSATRRVEALYHEERHILLGLASIDAAFGEVAACFYQDVQGLDSGAL